MQLNKLLPKPVVSFQLLNQLSLMSKGSITSVDLLLAPRAHLKHLKSHITCGDSPLMYIATQRGQHLGSNCHLG